MIEELFSKRRQIRAAWDQKKFPSKETIYDLLKRTLNIAPSKQNLFPFKIHAFGPKDIEEREIIGQICSLWETGSVNHWDDKSKNGDFYSAAGDLNIKDWVLDDEGNDMRNAPWVLVFEQRLAEENNFVREHHKLHQDGHRFTQTDPKRFRELCNTKLTCIEIGMYLQTLAGLCLENNLNISYIRTFPEWQWRGGRGEYKKESNKAGRLDWSSLPQITEAPLMIAQIGYVADVDDYFKSNSLHPNQIHWENKPSIDKVVQFKD
jgi:hypothetical protein